jgi:hypothetical protein
MNLLFELSSETGSRLNGPSPVRISASASHRQMILLYKGVALAGSKFTSVTFVPYDGNGHQRAIVLAAHLQQSGEDSGRRT